MSTKPRVNTLYTYKGYNMKKLLTVLLLTTSATAFAQNHWHGNGFGHHGHFRYHGGSNGNWVAPLIIGGVVGAVIASNRQQETIVLQQPQTVIVQRQTVCTEWKEIQTSDGQIYRERTCTQ